MEEHKQKLKTILDKMYDLRMSTGKYHALKALCDEMQSVINDMKMETTDEVMQRRLLGVYSALSHTSSKEIELVKYAQDQMRGKNAAKVRGREYDAALAKAIDMIHMDINILL